MQTRMTIEQLESELSAQFGGPAIGAWPRRAGERMRPHKGGGGGDPGAEARRQEEERQARIKAATSTINNVFNNKVQDANGNWVDGDPSNSRDAMYADQKSNVYDLNKLEVDRQAKVAERDNRFGLARNGLMGGSVDVDSNQELDRRTNEGLLRAGGIADQSAADLKTADERTRSNLLSMAQSGIDTGSAATMALEGLKVNADNVAQARAGATVGNLFSDLSNAYLMNQANQGTTAGMAYGQQNFGVSSPLTRYAGK